MHRELSDSYQERSERYHDSSEISGALKQYKDRRGEIVSSGSEKEALRARLGALREQLRELRAIFEVLSVLIRVLKVKLGAIRVILGRPRPMLGVKFYFFDT